MPKSPEALAEELNVVAEYAGIETTFAVEPAPQPGTSTVKTSRGETFLVDTAWALGNVKRLPDHTDIYQMLSALRVSHPDVKGVASKC
jgi:hypothetical protein